MLQQCSDLLESEEYLLPDEKYKLIRAMPHIMLLLDWEGDDNSSFNIFKQKKVTVLVITSTSHVLKMLVESQQLPNPRCFPSEQGIKLQTLQKLFKQFPVVPEYGDMAITLTYILQRAPHYNKETMGASWGEEPDSRGNHFKHLGGV
jgi:hypothetical protein